MATVDKVTNRINFASSQHRFSYPDFLDIQLKSFQEFFQLETTSENRIGEGLFKVFCENFPITDTMNVTVYLRNDSANLDSWYINQGLPTNGNSINCLFEDKIYWMTGEYPSGTPWGRWEFVAGDENISCDAPDQLLADVVSYVKDKDLPWHGTKTLTPSEDLVKLVAEGQAALGSGKDGE